MCDCKNCIQTVYYTLMYTFDVGEESFEASSVGEAAEVVQEQICDDELTLIKG